MNFSDRVNVVRRTLDPNGVYLYAIIKHSMPVRFEMLSAQMNTLWDAQDSYQIMKANMHVPLTNTDFPEPGYDLVDYSVQVVYPKLGWIQADGLDEWKITNKRFTASHVLYQLTIKEK